LGVLHGVRKNILLGGKRTKISLQSPKTEFGAQNQNDLVNFTGSKKKCTFGGQKGDKKPSENKNGIWGTKSILSCDISIDREFYME
jgi:hypothetical protein